MLGRSDGVLNPQGVRFGSAELYAVVEEMKDEWVLTDTLQWQLLDRYGDPPAPRVDDCIAVGQRTPEGDERV